MLGERQPLKAKRHDAQSCSCTSSSSSSPSSSLHPPSLSSCSCSFFSSRSDPLRSIHSLLRSCPILVTSCLLLLLAGTCLVYLPWQSRTSELEGPPIPLLPISQRHFALRHPLRRGNSRSVRRHEKDYWKGQAERGVRKILRMLYADSRVNSAGMGLVKVQQLSKVEGRKGGSIVIQGKRFDRTTLLTAMDTFFSSEQSKLLVAQAMEEEALEKDNGGQGEGTEVMAADALQRLEAGDLSFEDNWANAGEKYVSDAVAGASKVATYKYMIERDLGYAQTELQNSIQAADAASVLLQQYQSTYNAMTLATASAQSALDSANSKVTAAQADLAAAEAAQTADQTLQSDCPDLAAALATLESAQQAYQDALAAVTDATGTSCSPTGLSNCNTVADVAAVSSAAEQVSYAQGNVSAIQGSCAYYSAYNAAQTASTMSVSAAQAALSSAQAEQAAADAALKTAQANEDAALASVNAQQATYNQLKAVEAVKQDIVSKFLLAHKALACSPTASIPDYTDTSLCQYPSDNSKITYALSQAKAAAAEAERRALLDGILQDKAFWQQAIDALGGKKPALDQAISWWDAAKAERQSEGR